MFSSVSNMRVVPTRQNVHFPQDSRCVKSRTVTCGFNHAAVVADDDQSAGAHDRAELLQGVVIDLDIELVRGNAAAGPVRPSELP